MFVILVKTPKTTEKMLSVWFDIGATVPKLNSFRETALRRKALPACFLFLSLERWSPTRFPVDMGTRRAHPSEVNGLWNGFYCFWVVKVRLAGVKPAELTVRLIVPGTRVD
jgi:hypothetical protein